MNIFYSNARVFHKSKQKLFQWMTGDTHSIEYLQIIDWKYGWTSPSENSKKHSIKDIDTSDENLQRSLPDVGKNFLKNVVHPRCTNEERWHWPHLKINRTQET